MSTGAFGKVILARKKSTQDLFAIKILDKKLMIDYNVTEFVMNERNILQRIDNDYIVLKVIYLVNKFIYINRYG